MRKEDKYIQLINKYKHLKADIKTVILRLERTCNIEECNKVQVELDAMYDQLYDIEDDIDNINVGLNQAYLTKCKEKGLCD